MAFQRAHTALVLSLASACQAEAHRPTTWNNGIGALVHDRCGGCHHPSGIGGFDFTEHGEMTTWLPAARAAVESGTMPPWQPDPDCQEYTGSRALTDQQKDDLLAWMDAGAPLGSGASPVFSPPDVASQAWDAVLEVPEAYAPADGTDDYRCQVIEWDGTHAQYVTGFDIQPGEPGLVHHAAAFLVDADVAERYREFDAYDDGPGYPCFGAPVGLDQPGVEVSVTTLAGLRWLAAWVPGSANGDFPPGTGMAIRPGDIMVLQVHYNTLAATAAPDRTRVHLRLADQVERPAATIPFTDPGWALNNPLFGEPMTIPAGAPDVHHETTWTVGDEGVNVFTLFTADIGIGAEGPFAVHRVGHHMHKLGTRGRTSIQHTDGSESCLLDIPDWDFDWQDMYTLTRPAIAKLGDTFSLSCNFDNSASNQQVIDGEEVPVADRRWGDGTLDEMCLGVLYVTAP